MLRYIWEIKGMCVSLGIMHRRACTRNLGHYNACECVCGHMIILQEREHNVIESVCGCLLFPNRCNVHMRGLWCVTMSVICVFMHVYVVNVMLTFDKSTRVLAWSLSFLCSILTLRNLQKKKMKQACINPACSPWNASGTDRLQFQTWQLANEVNQLVFLHLFVVQFSEMNTQLGHKS